MKIIIAGAYAIGTHLARLFAREHENIILMDEDEERLERSETDLDLLTINSSPTSVKALKEAGAEDTDLFIAVTPDENTNITACILAKAMGAKKTVAKIDNAEYMEHDTQELFKQLGISSLIYPEMLAATDIINGLKMSWVRQRWEVHDGALVMMGIKLRESCEILNQPLRTLCGPDDPYHVVAIKRMNETIIPGGNDSLQLYDMAYFMTTRQYIPYIRQIVGKEHYADVKNVMIMGGGATAVRAVKNMPYYMDAKIIEAGSPDKKNVITIETDNQVSYSLSRNGTKILDTCPLSLTVGNDTWGTDKCRKVTRKSVSEKVEFIVPRKYKETVDNYNQVELIYKDYKIEFRIYNDGL